MTNEEQAGVTTGENSNETQNQPNLAEELSKASEKIKELENQLGSHKRELKDLRKLGSENVDDGKKEIKTEHLPDNSLLEKAYLRSAQITSEDEVNLALDTAKKWGMEIDKLVDDEDFKVKLEKLRREKSNIEATSNIRGSGNNSSQAKNTPEYWLAKGVPPTREDIPDSNVRRKISRAFLSASKNNGRTFYND